jgi:FkbM family methyltransferase
MSSAVERHRLPDGLTLWGDLDDGAITRPIVEGRYELNELDFVARTVRPGDHVVDVGAHLGAYTLRLARAVGPQGHVTAIEPDRAHVEALRRSVLENGFRDRTTIVAAAAADAAGTARLRSPGAGSSSAHARIVSTDDHSSGDSVPVVRIDDVIETPVQFVKMDVEGAEARALRGAWRVLASSRPVLLVELHPHLMEVSGDTPAGLIQWMAGLGYTCRLLGAGVATSAIHDTPSNHVTSVVFLPDAPGDARVACSQPAGVR